MTTLETLRARRDALDITRAELDVAIRVLETIEPTALPRKRNISVAGRKAISRAVKARWRRMRKEAREQK